MMFLQRRGRKGSGDLPGLQSRRFDPSRAEWWIRLPHASASLVISKGQRRRADPPFAKFAKGRPPTEDSSVSIAVAGWCLVELGCCWVAHATPLELGCLLRLPRVRTVCILARLRSRG